MTVKELIETLKTCDENANVVIEQLILLLLVLLDLKFMVKQLV